MTKRSIDKNWKALLQSGAVTHTKKKIEPVNYEKKVDGKKTIWFDVDKSILEKHDALMPSKGKASSLKNKIVAIDCEMVGIGFGGKKSVLARASVVSGDGEVLIGNLMSKMTASLDNIIVLISFLLSDTIIGSHMSIQTSFVEPLRKLQTTELLCLECGLRISKMHSHLKR